MQGKNFLEEFHLHWIHNMISIDFDPKESAKRSFMLEGFYPHKVVMRAPLRKLLGDDEKINFFSQRKIGYYC